MHGALLAIPLTLSLAGAPASDRFGAVASAPLPAGSLAAYGLAGYPELRAGFRQGFSRMEMTVEAGVNYLQLKVDAEAIARARIYAQGPLRLSMEVSLGGFANGGSQLEDYRNSRSMGARFGVASALTYQTSWPVSVFASARIPVEVPITTNGITRMTALLGGGVEVGIAEDTFVVFQGACGSEYRRPTDGLGYFRLAVEAMVGLGYRLF